MIYTLLFTLSTSALAREIVFPSAAGYATNDQVVFGGNYDTDISQAKFSGLNTYANLPYVHCLAAEGEDVEKFDIAILGAPFDTVSSNFQFEIFFISLYDCLAGNFDEVHLNRVVVEDQIRQIVVLCLLQSAQ
jgi:hypothetical protein